MQPWLALAASKHPDRPAVEGPTGALTYRQLAHRAAGAAGALRALGIGVGDQVALALADPIELIVALHACLLLGAPALPIDLRLSEREQAERAAQAKLVVRDPLGPPAGQGELACFEISGDAVTPNATDRDAAAVVMHTSGTTARAKPVPLSRANLLASALGSAIALGLDPRERWLCPLPLTHVGGLSIPVRSAIYATTAVLGRRFDTQGVLSELMDPARRITLVSLVPTMLERLLEAGLERPPTLRWALLGGAPIPPGLLDRARAAGVPVAPTYGMTEACSQIATFGWPLAGVELRLAGSPGQDGGVAVGGGEQPEPKQGERDPGELGERGPGRRGQRGPGRRGQRGLGEILVPPGLGELRERGPGEILVRGPIVSRACLADDGWLHTGDVGVFDERGRLIVTGRLSDTIITGGENVAPAEVEAVLLEHPEVVDAAVVGRPDPEWGEALVALVVPREGGPPDPEELRRHCRLRLAAFKVPKRIEFVDCLPRGASGKLLRRQLR